MIMEPSISILTPVWNGLPYLKECIRSVLYQDYDAWELIISDNGSTDGTREYLRSLNDPRIRVVEQEKNLGIIGNTNYLFSQARAPISQILCADDYFTSPEAIAILVNYWKNASPDIGFATFNHIQRSKRLIINLESEVLPSVIKRGQADIWFFIFGNFPGNLSNVSVRTSLVAEAGYLDKDYPSAGDFEFWLRASQLKDIGVQREDIIYVRRHDKVASKYLSLKGELYEQHLGIYQKIIDRLSVSYDRKKLMKYFSLEICSFHYRNALILTSKGRFGYLKKVLFSKSPILLPVWQQLLYGWSYVFLNRHQKLTHPVAKKMANQELNPQYTAVPPLSYELN